eukprot:TRINITY_DN2937_c0_g1_i2.p1 TRINITY_DN2937_c0_g1~~TRINITY_DN2937_c0_g1_i2.p1  ORF type:complete len:169 (+),score=52.60 TRINITY_DN2937_c0_g1_i2:43-507(+)
MGRRGGGGFGRRSGGGGFGGSSKAPPKAAPKPAAQNKTNSQPANTASATPAVAAPAQGGFLRNVAEIGAGIAVGHVAAHALENIFFGGKSGHQASPEEIKEVESKVKSGPCGIQYESFNKCLSKNDDDIAQCDWAFDMFKECQTANKEQTLAQY